MNLDKKREKIRRKALEDNSDLITARNRNRLAMGFGLILLLLFALIFRMGYWQIYKSDELKVMANEALVKKTGRYPTPIRDSEEAFDKMIKESTINKNN